jgi:hypothetical protein
MFELYAARINQHLEATGEPTTPFVKFRRSRLTLHKKIEAVTLLTLLTLSSQDEQKRGQKNFLILLP